MRLPRSDAALAMALALSFGVGCDARSASTPFSAARAAALSNIELPTPGAPAAPTSCPISDTAQTWSASLKCNKGNGGCKINETGTLVIQRTGPTTASVVADGIYSDTGASFDPKSCTVSHSGFKPPAPFDISISYAVGFDAKGALAGSAQVNVKNDLFGCKGQYSVSGTKQ